MRNSHLHYNDPDRPEDPECPDCGAELIIHADDKYHTDEECSVCDYHFEDEADFESLTEVDYHDF